MAIGSDGGRAAVAPAAVSGGDSRSQASKSNRNCPPGSISPSPLPQQNLLALHDDRQLGQRPLDAGQIAGQRRQLPLDRPRRHARRQQLGQPPGGGHLLKIEIRQPPHLADRHDQPAPMPAANHRHRHAEQLGQHGGRVEPVDVVLRVDQPQPLPELRLGDDLDRPCFGRLPRGLVEPVVETVGLGQRQLVLADHDQIGRGVGLFQHRRPVAAATNCAASRRAMLASLPTKATRLSWRRAEG